MPFYAEQKGWKLYQHPAFQIPFEHLVAEVQQLQDVDPANYSGHPKAKLLKRILELILDEIPTNPGGEQYRQGNTFGTDYRHWRRAKFLQRFRLFFRYHEPSKIIIYGWLNDENSLRKSGSKTDPYTIFRNRLDKGNPPDDWETLAFKSTEKPDE
jgi:toxin YhaV